ncbi:DoxX family protein [Streptomyces sp. NBC_01217]|uniref:DoxX family protein n=1 Tax=Streptomyces sp. NBC_01217 TaxID=2903779 RepID=UPI002E0F5C4C|nr:DoxX family protein [Streptomyces sp. NBC_01217]
MKSISEQLRAIRVSRTDIDQQPAATAGDYGLLLLRITFGLLMIGHGSQKLFGFYGGDGGDGLTETARSFASLGYRPGTLFAVLAGISEIGGGLGLILGVLTPLASAIIVGVMINAMVNIHAQHGLWVAEGGLEYTMSIAVVALALAAIGPVRIALDRYFRWGKGGWREAGTALGLGGIGSAIVLSL